MPPSASHRPIWASTSLSMNCLPLDRPRSMTNLACGLAPVRSDEKLNPAETRPVPAANSGCPGDGACDPFPPFCSPRTVFLELGRPLGRKGAPHSSQYCDPSRFSVLHLSQVIIASKKSLHFSAKAAQCANT